MIIRCKKWENFPNIYNLLKNESDRNSTLKQAINIIKKFIYKVLQNILDVTENNREKELQSIKSIQVEVKQEKIMEEKQVIYDTWVDISDMYI